MLLLQVAVVICHDHYVFGSENRLLIVAGVIIVVVILITIVFGIVFCMTAAFV